MRSSARSVPAVWQMYIRQKTIQLNRFVAVKVLKPEFRKDKGFITKFRVEAQSAAGLAHPNIVNVYDVGEDNGI